MDKNFWYLSKILGLLFGLFFVVSCQKQVYISPIDEDVNQAVLESQNARNYYFLYFEIGNFEDSSPKQIAEKTLDYLQKTQVEKRILSKKSEFHCYFYQKKLFKDYQKYLKDEELQNDYGSFYGESENLVVAVHYTPSDNNPTERRILVYQPNAKETQILYKATNHFESEK